MYMTFILETVQKHKYSHNFPLAVWDSKTPWRHERHSFTEVNSMWMM